ncbi:unnamed protein product [Rotaria sp. Silwood1]|nr:unnamed protein product [Rotaria sp. Silwood1]CAF1605030.1 unnamed protein product [Rotaria sp. Silwood1]
MCNISTNRYAKDERKLPDHGENGHLKLVRDNRLVKKEDSPLHDGNTHHTKCDICDKWPIMGDRYRCLECTDFDVCGDCFEKRRETENHRSGHAFVHFKVPMELFGMMIDDVDTDVTIENLIQYFQNAKHQGVACDGCSAKSITGIRFKCDTCPSYDLCLKCMKKKKETRHHTAKHPLIIMDENNLKVIETSDIELGHKLGQGNFGSVYQAKWISRNQQVACKVFDVLLNPLLIESFVKELSAYNELSGAYILKLYGFVHHTPTNSNGGVQCMLIMEYMSKGSLTTVIEKEKISYITKLNIALNIASGMRKLHGRKMIHRDIRPDNILVNEDYTAKIGDLGIAFRIETKAQQMVTNTGCISYMPPEFYQHKCDQSLDVFTFGLTLYFMFTETSHVYQNEGHQIILTKRCLIFQEIIDRCVHHDPKQRPLATELEAIFALYKRTFEKHAAANSFNYKTQPLTKQNRFFFDFYKSFHTRDKAAIEIQYARARAKSYDFTDSDAIKSAVFGMLMKTILEKEVEEQRMTNEESSNKDDDDSDADGYEYYDD